MQTLEQWLSEATHGLCAASVERVRAEINEHYTSAIESEGAVDDDPVRVERRAVAALGDAKTANRQYRRVLLTESDNVWLRRVTSTSYKWRLGIFMSLSAVALVAIPETTLGFIRYLYIIIIADGLLQVVPVRSTIAGRIVRTVRWGLYAVCLTIASVHALAEGVMFVPAIAMWVVTIAHAEYKLFVLRRKVPVAHWPRRLWS